MSRSRRGESAVQRSGCACVQRMLLLTGAFLSACTPEQPCGPPTNMAEASEAEAPPSLPSQERKTAELADPPAPPPPAPSLPGLMPLGEAQIAAALGSSASCRLSERGAEGGTVMVAMLGMAIVNDRGRIVHLEPEAKDWNALLDGGTFRAAGFRVEVDAGAVVSRRGGGVERDTSVDIVRGRHGFGTSHGPRWICGS